MSIVTRKKLPRKACHPIVTPAYHAEAASLLHPSGYFRWKSLFDRALAFLLLAPGLPIVILLVLLVRLTSRGPGIYRQVRIGQHGRKFMMYKIRTMCRDAEVVSGPVWTQAHDPRTTPVGRVLRRLHLDELPQLLNILKGEMSLVGPRPERPEFVHVLAEAIPGYLNRLVVPPGITGLAQLNLPPDSDLVSVRRKLVLDCEYIERASPWLDVRLCVCTFFRMLKLPEHWLLMVFGLRRNVAIPSHPKIESVATEGENGDNLTPATPTSILTKAATTPGGSRSSGGYHEYRGKHRHRTTDQSKPR